METKTKTDLTRDDLKQLVRKAANKERRILNFSILFSVIAVVAGALWLFYAYNRVRALDVEYAARVASQKAQISEKDAELKRKSEELDQKSAAVTEKQKELDQLQEGIKAFRQFSVQALSELNQNNGQGQTVNEQRTLQAIDNSLNANPKAANLLPRVYIHIGSEEQQAKAREIETALQKQGFLAPGLRNVKDRAPKLSVLKFFREAERAEATQIANLLKNFGVNAPPQYIKGFEDSTKMRPRHYEVWFGSDF